MGTPRDDVPATDHEEAHVQVKVDGGKCQGHARCWALAPQLFHLNDEGYMETSVIAVPPELEVAARRAVRACPERALTPVGVDD